MAGERDANPVVTIRRCRDVLHHPQERRHRFVYAIASADQEKLSAWVVYAARAFCWDRAVVLRAR